MPKPNVRVILRRFAAMAVVVGFTVAPQVARAEAPGSLAQLASPNNCIQWPQGSSGCPTTGQGLDDTIDVAVSPDGQNVYVLGFNDAAIAEFQRNPDGSLTQLAGSNACIADTTAPFNGSCANDVATGLVRPAAIVVSPDGKNVYVAATDSANNGTIAEFARNSDGSLTQLAGPHDCIAETSATQSPCGGQTGHGIAEPRGLAISPDGTSLYAVDPNGRDIAVFARATDGSLSEPNGSDSCVQDATTSSTECGLTATGLGSVDAVAISPDGANLYTGGDQNPGTIAEFARNSDGSLTQLASPNNCIEEQGTSTTCGTETGRGISEVVSLAVSPDGGNLYATSFGTAGAIAEFTRNPDGSLTQLGNGNDCIAEHGSSTDCAAQGNGLDGADEVAVSPDGADVYVATSAGDCCHTALAEFARSSSDGSLTQLTSPDDCIENSGGADCGNESGTGLGDGRLAISPDGTSLYATGFSDIAELSRTPVLHTLTALLAGSGTGGISDGGGGIACPSACSHAYTANSHVTLTASAASGSTFSGWSGACSGTGPCQVTMSADMAVTATFTANVVPPAPGSPAPVLTGASSAVTDSAAGFSGSVDPEGLPTTVYFQYGLDRRYSQVGTSGPDYTQQTPAQSVGSDFTVHGVGPVAVAGLVPNALYHVRLVATNSAGTTFGQDVTFTTAMAPAPGTPTLGQTFNVAPVSGLVLVLINGHLVPLTQLQQIPAGVAIDSRHGTFELIISPGGGAAHDAAAKGKTQSGKFGGAVVRLHQIKSGANRGLTTVMMVESAFKGAPSQAICNAPAADAHAAKISSKVIQLLHASAHGKFATSGRYSAATVRGTVWTIIARCDGTLVRDITDSVVVTDFVRHKTVVLHAGQSYLAPGTRKHR